MVGPLWFAALFLGSSLLQWAQPNKFPFWVSGDVVWKQHRYGRLLSALFVHGDFVHLASNLPLFIFFAWLLQFFFGRWIFPGVAILVGVLSNLATLYFYDPDMRMLGASGMIYGMIAMWLVYFIYFERNLTLKNRLLRAFGFALMMLVPRTYEPTVSYMSHASGFILGIAFGFMTLPFVKVNAPAVE